MRIMANQIHKMKNKTKYGVKEHIIIFFFLLVFISPVFILQEGPKLAYVIIIGMVGFFVGREYVFYLKQKKKTKEEKNIFLSKYAINTYVMLYFSTFILIDFNFSKEIFIERNLLTFLLWIIFGTWNFYVGLQGIKTKEIIIRGYSFYNKGAIIFSILVILSSFFIMFLPIIT